MRSSFSRLRSSFDRLRGAGTAEPDQAEPDGDKPRESYRNQVSPIDMSQTSPKLTEELLEASQNTDPVSDPADDLTTGIEGTESTAQPQEPVVINASAQADAGVADAAQANAAQANAGPANAAQADEVDRLRAERDALLDRLARLQAEFENARRRAERERTEFRDYAISGAVEQFLPVLDNFTLALNATGSAEQLRQGVELIVKQMEEVLRNLNVQPVETVGAQFDPRFHEALGEVESTELPDGQVHDEVRRGYRIKDKLLRPALVRIVSNPQGKQA